MVKFNINKNIIQYFETTDQNNLNTQNSNEKKAEEQGLIEKAKQIQEATKATINNTLDNVFSSCNDNVKLLYDKFLIDNSNHINPMLREKYRKDFKVLKDPDDIFYPDTVTSEIETSEIETPEIETLNIEKYKYLKNELDTALKKYSNKKVSYKILSNEQIDTLNQLIVKEVFLLSFSNEKYIYGVKFKDDTKRLFVKYYMDQIAIILKKSIHYIYEKNIILAPQTTFKKQFKSLKLNDILKTSNSTFYIIHSSDNDVSFYKLPTNFDETSYKTLLIEPKKNLETLSNEIDKLGKKAYFIDIADKNLKNNIFDIKYIGNFLLKSDISSVNLRLINPQHTGLRKKIFITQLGISGMTFKAYASTTMDGSGDELEFSATNKYASDDKTYQYDVDYIFFNKTTDNAQYPEYLKNLVQNEKSDPDFKNVTIIDKKLTYTKAGTTDDKLDIYKYLHGETLYDNNKKYDLILKNDRVPTLNGLINKIYITDTTSALDYNGFKSFTFLKELKAIFNIPINFFNSTDYIKDCDTTNTTCSVNYYYSPFPIEPKFDINTLTDIIIHKNLTDTYLKTDIQNKIMYDYYNGSSLFKFTLKDKKIKNNSINCEIETYNNNILSFDKNNNIISKPAGKTNTRFNIKETPDHNFTIQTMDNQYVSIINKKIVLNKKPFTWFIRQHRVETKDGIFLITDNLQKELFLSTTQNQIKLVDVNSTLNGFDFPTEKLYKLIELEFGNNLEKTLYKYIDIVNDKPIVCSDYVGEDCNDITTLASIDLVQNDKKFPCKINEDKDKCIDDPTDTKNYLTHKINNSIFTMLRDKDVNLYNNTNLIEKSKTFFSKNSGNEKDLTWSNFGIIVIVGCPVIVLCFLTYINYPDLRDELYAPFFIIAVYLFTYTILHILYMDDNIKRDITAKYKENNQNVDLFIASQINTEKCFFDILLLLSVSLFLILIAQDKIKAFNNNNNNSITEQYKGIALPIIIYAIYVLVIDIFNYINFNKDELDYKSIATTTSNQYLIYKKIVKDLPIKSFKDQFNAYKKINIGTITCREQYKNLMNSKKKVLDLILNNDIADTTFNKNETLQDKQKYLYTSYRTSFKFYNYQCLNLGLNGIGGLVCFFIFGYIINDIKNEGTTFLDSNVRKAFMCILLLLGLILLVIFSYLIYIHSLPPRDGDEMSYLDQSDTICKLKIAMKVMIYLFVVIYICLIVAVIKQ